MPLSAGSPDFSALRFTFAFNFILSSEIQGVGLLNLLQSTLSEVKHKLKRVHEDAVEKIPPIIKIIIHI